MTAGVYAITNTANGTVYVGSSGDIERRWATHRTALSNGISENKRLNADWSMSCGVGFEFSILEETDSDNTSLVAAEQHWIDHFRDRCYNSNLQATRSMTELSKTIRLNIYLGDEDRALAEYIQEDSGLRSLSAAIRVALRRTARQLRDEAQRRSPAACQDCGLRHDPGDKANCIEGHGDDPHPFVPDPVKPLCRDCDKPEVYHRG